MSKIKDMIMEANEMGITFDTNEEMFEYLTFKYLFDKTTLTGSKAFERIVNELGEY